MFYPSKNYIEGTRVLNKYFAAIPVANRPWATFSECLEWYTTDQDLKKKYPKEIERWRYYDFIETLGSNAFILANESKLSEAIKRVANATTASKAPSAWSFGQAMVNQATKLTFDELKKAVGEGLKEAGSAVVDYSSKALGTYLFWLSIPLLIYFFTRSRK